MKQSLKFTANNLEKLLSHLPDDKFGLFIDTHYHDIAVLDIESPTRDDFGNWVFEQGAVYYRGEARLFYDVLEMWEYCKDIKAPVYAHNMDFDMLFFFQQTDAMKSISTPIIQAGNLTIKIDLGFDFRNSLSLLPMPLKKVVTKFLQIDDKSYLSDKDNVLTITPEERGLYCLKDCIYLSMALAKYNKFVLRYGVSLRLTTPATALRIFKKSFTASADKKTVFDPAHRKTFFADNYYYGGHSEKFVSGQYVFRNVNYYDVNSLYPYIMQDLELGTSKPLFERPTKQNIKKLLKSGDAFYCEITLTVNREELRFFPTFDEKRKINKYLYGDIRIKVSEVGINFILKWGSWDNIKAVHAIITYGNNKSKPFKSYVETFYNVRLAEPEYNETAKLLLNALYGKYAEHLEKRVRYINTPRPKGSHPISTRQLAFGAIDEYVEEAPFYKHADNRLDIAGKITESARLHVGNIINDIRQYGNVYYTDTDSIITSVDLESVMPHLVDSKTLGKLKNEIGYKDNAIILGVKMYSFYKSGKMARKGVKKMTHENFKEIVRGRTSFENTRFTKLHSLIDRGFFGIQISPYDIKTILERLD